MRGLDGAGSMSEGSGAKRAPFAKVLSAVCALALTLGLAGCTLFIPSRSEVEEETVSASLSSPTIAEDGVLTVAMNTSDAPQSMTGSDGDLEGYDIDVALAIADQLGLSVKVIDSSSAADAINNQGADIYIGVDSDYVADGLTASEVYLQDATAIFTNTSSISADSVSATSMEGATVGVQESSASQDALTRAGILSTQQTYSNVNECFEALEAGEVDYVACDATSGAYLARMYSDISFAGTISATSSYVIVMSESNEELVTAVTDALEDVDGDGTLDALHTAWYGDLPTSLTGLQIEGVTVEDEEGEEESSEVSSEDEDLMVTDDINSLD